MLPETNKRQFSTPGLAKQGAVSIPRFEVTEGYLGTDSLMENMPLAGATNTQRSGDGAKIMISTLPPPVLQVPADASLWMIPN